MQTEQVLQEFTDAGAILRGHFILSSGLHSDTYLQCALALRDATRAQRLCAALAGKIRAEIDLEQIDIVVSPAMGGIVVGYEIGRQLGKPAIFCERVDGSFTLRRGFSLEKSQRVLIVEDVVTTGKSSLETVTCIESYGANAVAEACLINRNGTANPLAPMPLIALAGIEVKTFSAHDIPIELQATAAVKPGSRGLK